MIIMKRISVFILISIFLLNFTVCAENIKNISTEPEESSDFYITELLKLGILGDSLDMTATAKRNEIAKLVSKTLLLPETLIPSTFEDVDENTPNSGYISTMQMNGIMIGNTEKMFLPEKEITSDELIKTLISMLGYSTYADKKGGYPEGYLITAKEIGLIDDEYINKTVITNEYASKLVYKSLNLPLMKQTVFGPEPEYVICNGEDAALETVLSDYWGIK